MIGLRVTSTRSRTSLNQSKGTTSVAGTEFRWVQTGQCFSRPSLDIVGLGGVGGPSDDVTGSPVTYTPYDPPWVELRSPSVSSPSLEPPLTHRATSTTSRPDRGAPCAGPVAPRPRGVTGREGACRGRETRQFRPSSTWGSGHDDKARRSPRRPAGEPGNPSESGGTVLGEGDRGPP